MTSQTPITIALETLRFGYGDTKLGSIMVVESLRGVVALFIDDDRAKLSRDLKDAFPDASCIPDQTGLMARSHRACQSRRRPKRSAQPVPPTASRSPCRVIAS
jgi:hypothetical protein